MKFVKDLKLDDQIMLSSGIDLLTVEKGEYTAIEIFPTVSDIPAGMEDTNEPDNPNSVANLFGFDNRTATGLKYIEGVSATGLDVTIDCYFDRDGMDESIYDKVYVDWGDGTVQKYSECRSGNYAIHTYGSTRKYILKVYGPAPCLKIIGNNCISRIWDTDLPMASTFWNMGSMCAYSQLLLKVKVPAYNYKFPAVMAWNGLFQHTHNLQIFCWGSSNELGDASNKALPLPRVTMIDTMFSMASNLKTLIWDPQGYGRLPESENCSYTWMYNGCKSLTASIDNFLPIDAVHKFGWGTSDQAELNYMFSGCSSIPAMDAATAKRLGRLLWNGDLSSCEIEDGGRYMYPNRKATFRNCPNLLSAIPPSWIQN